MSGIVVNTKNTEILLQAWGKWSSSGLGLGIGRGDYTNVTWINDDVALIVDRLVAQLGVDHPVLKDVLLKVYCDDYNYPMLANALKCGETRARQLHISAIAWVDGGICAMAMDVA